MKYLGLLVLLAMLTSCSSDPVKEGPDWIRSPSRTVDNGYIVYVGYADDINQERARFLAEGVALEDLANECSFIPKGARIEDRYVGKQKTTYGAYVKLAIEFKDCDQAQKSLDPATVKEHANIAFTETLKRYQDFAETGEMSDTRAGEIEPLQTISPTPVFAGNDNVHFYAVRQYVAYQKEVVIMAPPTAYPPGSPAVQTYTSAVQPASQQVASYTEAHPELKSSPQTWSHIPDRPVVARPAGLQARRSSFQQMKPPKMEKPRSAGQHKGQGHHSHHHSEGGEKRE